MDSLVAIDVLDDLLHNSPETFLSGDARIKPDELEDALVQLREGLMSDVHGAEASWGLFDQIEAQVAAAKPATLGRRVRIDKEALYELLDELRVTVPEDARGSRAG